MNTQPSNAKSQHKVTAFDSRVDASPDLVQQAPVPYIPGQMSRDDWKLSESLRSNIDAASQQSVSVKVEDLIQRVLLDTVHPIVVNTRKRQSIILDSMRQSSQLEKAFEEFQVQQSLQLLSEDCDQDRIIRLLKERRVPTFQHTH